VPKDKIGGVELERAENLIRILFESGEWPRAATQHMGIDEAALSKYMAHHVGTLRAMYKDIDPRHEAAIATMLSHVFFCGVAAGRGTGYSTDEGLVGR
jgi:hypothetical protein